MASFRSSRHFPRKIIKKRPPAWFAKIVVKKGHQNDEFEHRIYFGAYNGGMAKKKALPKIQSFLEQVLSDCGGSPRVQVFLKKVSINGNRWNNIPTYVLRERYSYFSAIIKINRPAQVFKVADK